jgi:hypothetical protein
MRNEKNCEQTEYSYSRIIYSLFSCYSYGYYVLSERRKEINIEFCAKNYNFLDFIPKGNERIAKNLCIKTFSQKANNNSVIIQENDSF